MSLASGLQFIRAECFVFSHVADEGLMDGCAGSLLRYRRMIGAEQILVLTDIKKKHRCVYIWAMLFFIQENHTSLTFETHGFISHTVVFI